MDKGCAKLFTFLLKINLSFTLNNKYFILFFNTYNLHIYT